MPRPGFRPGFPPALVLASVLLVGSGCSAPSAGGRYPGAPVVLISIDTLRADHLPLYGYKSGSTPAIDALGREGVVFEDVYSQAPLTLPSHASLFTGLIPPHHGVRDNIGFTLKPEALTLATRFKDAGLATGGAISAYVLRAETGIARGFDAYDDAVEIEGGTESLGLLRRDGGAAVKSLARWVEGVKGRRFFAFLHLYEPHTPYRPPERHAHFKEPYDGSVAYADELVGRFLERLKGLGLYESTVIALTSDHGEGLGQHGEAEHGIFLYTESVHVPLVLRLPGGAAGGRRVPGTVAGVDIPATLLDLAGVAPTGLDGVSLRTSLGGGPVPPRSVYSETLYPRYHFGWSDLYAATEARLRYIRSPRAELYDRKEDPGETRNLLGSRGAAVAAMDAWISAQVGPGGPAAPEEAPLEVRERLQALGYIGSESAPLQAGTTLPDPKDEISNYEELKRALTLRMGGQDAEAVAVLRALVKARPAMIDAWETLGYTFIRMGKTKEGIDAVERALKLDPQRMTAHLALAKVYGLEGRLDLAVAHAEIASAKNPGQGNELLAQVMMDRSDLARAAEFARKSVAADPKRIMSHFILGVAAQRAGRYEEALASFRRAEEAKRLETHAKVLNLHANIGDCLARLGRDAEAEQAFLAELHDIPSSESGRVGLALLYRSEGRDAEARLVLEGLITALPHPGPDAFFAVARTFAVLGDAPKAQEWAARGHALFPRDARFALGAAGR